MGWEIRIDPTKQPEPLERIQPNAAGIDCGSRHHHVAVPVDRDPEPVRRFKTFTPDLYRMVDWLEACRIDTVAMEATGVYWIPIYDILEQRGFKVVLVNARHVKNVPGRKTDVVDCQWIQELHEVGLLRGSFRPSAEIVSLRAYLRHRETLVQEAANHIRRMQKSLALMNVHLHNVITDITGLTGMQIVRDIASGVTDPNALASHRHSRCRASEEEIAAALTGNYRREQVFVLRQNLELYDSYQLEFLQFHLNTFGSSQGSVQLWPVPWLISQALSSIVIDLRGWRTPSVSGEELQALGKSGPRYTAEIARGLPVPRG